MLHESFAYQTVQLLRNKNIHITAPEIIAKTGWTTDELMAAIEQTTFLKQYDFVSLLIGVNNQYRGRSIENFEIEFENLLKKAIVFAGNNAKNVFVLSIPDWGVTPFAADRDGITIATKIDQFNDSCKNMVNKYNCIFIDITTSQRADAGKPAMLAPDGLHPSALEYKKWAIQLSNKINDFHFA